MMLNIFFFLFLAVVLTQKYRVTKMETVDNGIQGELALSSASDEWPEIISELKFHFYYESKERLRLKILDKNNERWEVPNIVLSETPKKAPTDVNYYVKINQDPFEFTVVRKEDDYIIWSSVGKDFIYANQYIQFASTMRGEKNPHFYGLGERIHDMRLDNTGKLKHVIWNKDHGTPVDENLYGSHAYLLELEKSGKAHAIFLLNSNAQDVVLSTADDEIKWRTIGGVIDLFFFMGGTPGETVKQYQEVIGKPNLQPMWSLGAHQCRWGYKNLAETKEVVVKYKENNIPLETMWNDIDYMQNYKLFTSDAKNYPEADYKEFIEWLHSNNQRYMHIIDPGVKTEQGYFVYEEGKQKDIFIKNREGENLVNKVWPGYTVFPDYSLPAGKEFWEDQLKKFLKRIPIDGLWIDMNEVAGFCDGECDLDKEIDEQWVMGISKYEHRYSLNRKSGERKGFNPENPPYNPQPDALNTHTISMDAVHHIGLEYDVHNLYGLHEAVASHEALESITGKRPFIISRASYPGLGRFAGHWLGDNYASFNDLRYSIAGCLSMSLFGISTCGADICGFSGDSDDELCARWYQAGAFFTFMRNHNTWDTISQEPYALGTATLNSARTYTHLRYSLLPFFYTMQYLAHTEGETVFRPMFFNHHDEKDILPFLDREFMIGDAIMISPVVERGEREKWIYFPDVEWYSIYDGKHYTELGCIAKEFCAVEAPLEYVNIHVKGGNILPRKTPALTVTETLNTPYSLLVALDKKGAANGELYIDDGEAIVEETLKNKKYSLINFKNSLSGSKYTLTGSVVESGYQSTNINLSDVKIFGVNQQIGNVTINSKPGNFKYDSKMKVLSITDMDDVVVTKPFVIEYNF